MPKQGGSSDEKNVTNGRRFGNFFLPNLEGNGTITPSALPSATAKSESIDMMLAKELNKLSFKEREVISEEIHGIAVKHVAEETTTIRSKAFQDLDTELKKLCETKGGVGEMAHAFHRSQELFGSSHDQGTYLNTKKIRIMFIRCDRFDCKKAAERICRFANLMYNLYGDNGLERLAKLSDLDDKEMAVMKQGHCQVLPSRDRSGRRIYAFFSSDAWDAVPHKTKCRVLAYVFMAMLDESTQQKGIVALLWNKHLDLHACLTRAKLNEMVVNILPIRFGAIHAFFPSIDTYQNGFFGYLVAGIAQQVKPYVRIHAGSLMECIYIAESFGIISHQIPLHKATFELELVNHNRWLDLCVARETNNPHLPKKIIECPKNSDILFGRGSILMSHPGNIMYRNFLQPKLQEYVNIRRRDRKEMTEWTMELVRTLKKEYGARFLREEKIGHNITIWVEVPNELARSKLRVAFRDAKRRLDKSKGKGTMPTNVVSITHSKADDCQDMEPLPLTPISFRKRDFENLLTLDDYTSMSQVLSEDDYTSMSQVLSAEKVSDMTIHGNTVPLATAALVEQQQQQQRQLYSEMNNVNHGIASLDNSVRDINNTIKSLFTQQISDSSTSTFLRMDGSNSSKRPRLCAPIQRCIEKMDYEDVLQYN